MNPHQVPMQPQGTYNQSPQQQANNMIPPTYHPPIYPSYPQQYIPQAPNMPNYQAMFNNPQTNPSFHDMNNNRSNMGNMPQQDLITGMHPAQAINTQDHQIDPRSNIHNQYQQNPVQWHTAPGPFPNDPQFYQYHPNQRSMYMPMPPTQNPTPPPPPPQSNHPPVYQRFYKPYQSSSIHQQMAPHHSTFNKPFSNTPPKPSKKPNAHQAPKNTNQNKSNNTNQNNNNQASNQPKQKSSKSAKKQKKQAIHDTKKQNTRDTSSIDRIPPSITIEQQCQKWGWILPPLPPRSFNQTFSNLQTNETNSNLNYNSTGFTLKSLIKMNQDENDEEDSFIYNYNSDSSSNANDSDGNINNDNENENLDDDDDGVLGTIQEDENIFDSDSSSDEENDQNENDESNNTIDNETYTKLGNEYRDDPIKRLLFVWDELYKT